MEQAKNLIYDGSFNGFLSTIFKAFDEKINVLEIQKQDTQQNALFTDTIKVRTRIDYAKRVWNGIQTKCHPAIKNIYFAYLSEQKGIETLLYHYIRKLYFYDGFHGLDQLDDEVQKIHQLAHTVSREKYHLEKHIQFQKTKDQVHFAAISPEFNMLPLISKYFKWCYADKQWVIYDLKRKYGLFFNGISVSFIGLDESAVDLDKIPLPANHFEKLSSGNYYLNDYISSLHLKLHITRKLYDIKLSNKHWKQSLEKKAV
jgi:probable DNA metabolism protein